MLRLDLKRLGQLLVAPPRPTLRAFGTPPYLRIEAFPSLSASALAARLGSVYVICFGGEIDGVMPLGLYLELSLVSGYSMRAAWLRGRAKALQDWLFPSE